MYNPQTHMESDPKNSNGIKMKDLAIRSIRASRNNNLKHGVIVLQVCMCQHRALYAQWNTNSPAQKSRRFRQKALLK